MPPEIEIKNVLFIISLRESNIILLIFDSYSETSKLLFLIYKNF